MFKNQAVLDNQSWEFDLLVNYNYNYNVIMQGINFNQRPTS